MHFSPLDILICDKTDFKNILGFFFLLFLFFFFCKLDILNKFRKFHSLVPKAITLKSHKAVPPICKTCNTAGYFVP